MKTKKERELLLTESYNVILDERTSEKERKLLQVFNHSVESGKDFEVACRELKSALERLALSTAGSKRKAERGSQSALSQAVVFFLERKSRKRLCHECHVHP